MMETIKGIRTAEGVAQIDYDVLSNKPVIVNPNLLDNWYFGNPVNQRRLTEYDGTTGNMHTVDRWKIQGGAIKITINKGYITKNVTATVNFQGQAFEEPMWSEFIGKTVTASMLVRGLAGQTVRCAIYTNSLNTILAQQSKTLSTNDWELVTFTFNIPTTTPTIDFRCLCYPAFQTTGGSLDIKAVKLEFGDTQTLAHEENGVWVLNEIPNYADQLARCQRYFQIFRTETERKTYCEDFRPTMRTTDSGEVAKSTITINGVTYYTATADL